MAENIDLRMAEAIKLAKIAFFSYSFDGTILAIDKMPFDFFELEGIFKDPKSLIGKNIGELFVYMGPKGRIRDVIRTKRRISNLEYGIRTLKNTEKWGIHNSYIYIDKKTGEEAIQVCFYDITDRKLHEKEKIEQSEQRYKTLFEYSPDPIIILDLEYKIIEFNKATIDLLELKFENIIGRRFDELGILDRTQAAKYASMLQSMEKGENLRAIEVELIMKNGRSKWIELFPNLILQSGKSNGIQIISRDITDRKLG